MSLLGNFLDISERNGYFFSVILYLLLHSYNVNLDFRKSLEDFRSDSLDVLLLSLVNKI